MFPLNIVKFLRTPILKNIYESISFPLRKKYDQNCVFTWICNALKKIWRPLLIRNFLWLYLTLSWRRPLSYRNQSTDLYSKSMDWFLYDNGLRHERVNNLEKREWNLQCQKWGQRGLKNNERVTFTWLCSSDHQGKLRIKLLHPHISLLS